jgi:hypothetical protein
MRLQTNGHDPVSQPANRHPRRAAAARSRRRRPRASYQATIERRTVIAADAVKDGWTQKRAASVFCVNPVYVSLAGQASEDDRCRLLSGELKLAALLKDYRLRLAERRAKEADAQAWASVRADREAQAEAIHTLLDRVGVDRLLDAITDRFGFTLLFDVLDVNLKRRGRDLVEGVVAACGAERALRALDHATAPHAIAAE